MIRLHDVVEDTSVRISSTTHRVRVIAEPRRDVAVEGDAREHLDGARLTIDSVRGRLVVRVPEGTDLVVGTTSARVDVEGTVGDIAVVTTSGRVTIEDATSVDIRTASARVDVGRTSDECCIHTSSGTVAVESCGSADVATSSGRIVLGGVHGSVRAHCVSGRIEVGLTAPEDVDAATVSGRITVSVPPGVDVRTNEDRSVLATWPDGTECSIGVRSVSGRVDVSPR